MVAEERGTSYALTIKIQRANINPTTSFDFGSVFFIYFPFGMVSLLGHPGSLGHVELIISDMMQAVANLIGNFLNMLWGCPNSGQLCWSCCGGRRNKELRRTLFSFKQRPIAKLELQARRIAQSTFYGMPRKLGLISLLIEADTKLGIKTQLVSKLCKTL